MSMRVRADFVNPLSAMEGRSRAAVHVPRQGGRETAERLQVRRQQLQNQMLLLKATGTDAAGASAESQQKLEGALEEVTAALQAAKNDPVPSVEAVCRKREPQMDAYEPGKEETASFGSYRPIWDGKSRKILVSPCTDEP